MVKIKTKLLTTILISILMLSSIVFAVPGIPNVFYGTVTWNSVSAPDGTKVTAKINGVEVGSTTTSGGKYGYPYGSFYIDNPNGDRTGKTITFFVNDVNTGKTAVFTEGAWTELNLAAEGGITTTSSGGGGGGYVPPTTEEEEEEETTTGGTGGGTETCQETWVCGEWSECVNGVRTRECNDENNCETNNKEPFLSQPCSAEEVIEQGGLSGIITSFFLLSPTNLIIAAVLGLGVAILIIYLLRKQRKKK